MNTLEIDWFEVWSTNAVITWLMPSVAMKLFTRNFTTNSPLSAPVRAQAPRAMKMPATGGTVWCLASDVVMTRAIDIIAPMERSNVPVARGTRKARASTP